MRPTPLLASVALLIATTVSATATAAPTAGAKAASTKVTSPAPEQPPSQPRAARHALIVAIGDYMNPNIPPLLGVGHDVDSATKMATAMQIPAANIRVLRDHDATAARIEQEIAELNSRTRPGDRVFFYYSGHGTRYYSSLPADQGCVEALLPADSAPLTNARLATLMKPISDKVDKLMVFYDACHSGGIVGKPLGVTRSLTTPKGKLTPKFTPGGAIDACSKPTNIRTRSLGNETAKAGTLAQNIVLISSSRPDEVSFDDEDAGGVATQAWRDCMLHDAQDLDQSGAISINEISACAQVRIDARFKGNAQFGAQHMIIGGNAGFVPGWLTSTAAATAPAAVAATSAATPATPPAVVAVAAASATPATVQAAPGAALADILAQSDPRRQVTVNAPTRMLKIGKDALDLSVTSSHAGYVYVVMLGSDKKSYYMLFPNDRDGENYIKAGDSMKLPRPNWRITAQGPAGTDRMLVVVSATPRDLTQLGNNKAGPFTYNLTDAGGRARLQWLLGTSVGLSSPECQPGAARDATTAERCSDAFGAVITEFHEL
ncbi:MAG: caspase family protein [Burkholderiaceae bacterium]|nr:caspase family protein [Burkholderiaceae bacterium]